MRWPTIAARNDTTHLHGPCDDRRASPELGEVPDSNNNDHSPPHDAERQRLLPEVLLGLDIKLPRARRTLVQMKDGAKKENKTREG